jgi:ComF family protein
MNLAIEIGESNWRIKLAIIQPLRYPGAQRCSTANLVTLVELKTAARVNQLDSQMAENMNIVATAGQIASRMKTEAKSWFSSSAGLSGALSNLLECSQYLLFQEKCRICQRSIHPEFQGMDDQLLRPPAFYNCLGKKFVSFSLCRTCWLILESGEAVCRVYDIDETGLSLAVASSKSFQDEIKKLILRFKYDGDLLLTQDLSILALHAWRQIDQVIDPNLAIIVPVPLHSSKLRERRFNQAELLAEHIGKCLAIKIACRALKRVKKTASQQSLGKLKRQHNVAGAFKAQPKLVKEKQILLVDDVCTSGATLVECARTLYNAGAALVVALTVARVD